MNFFIFGFPKNFLNFQIIETTASLLETSDHKKKLIQTLAHSAKFV